MEGKDELYKSELRAIGSIVHHWSYLEHAVERLIWILLEVEGDIGRAVTADIQFRARVTMLGKLIQAKHPPMADVWAGTAKTLKEIEVSRNLIVHGIWGRSPDSSDAPEISLRRASSGPDRIYGEKFSADRMKQIDDNILQAGTYLVDLEEVIEGANAALRKSGGG